MTTQVQNSIQSTQSSNENILSQLRFMDFDQLVSGNYTNISYNHDFKKDTVPDKILSALGINNIGLDLDLLVESSQKDYLNPNIALRIRSYGKIDNFVSDNVVVSQFKAVYKKTEEKITSFWSRSSDRTTSIRCETTIYALLEIGKYKIPCTSSFSVFEKLFDAKITKDMFFEIHGTKFPIDCISEILSGTYVSRDNYKLMNYTMCMHDLQEVFLRHIYTLKTDNLKNLVNGIRDIGKCPIVSFTSEHSGISKIYQQVKKISDECYLNEAIYSIVFEDMAKLSKKTINSVKMSNFFNSTFEKVTNVKEFKSVIDNILCRFPLKYEESPTFLGLRKKSLKSKSNKAFHKLMQEYEFLNLDESHYPNLTQCIQEAEIPISIFFRKKEQYFLLNDNFDLWEEMIIKYKDVTIELAKEASRRTTYEKDLMSYFYFILYGLPEYLEKHTGYKWTCSPKLVNSERELNPPSQEESGIVRQRSALTPIVDNDNKTVVVPYASLSIGGVQTSYCYSHNYSVLYRGLSFQGNAVISDLEERLNGRDDYGLMFYTLTGSSNTRGYPTFLIIFERLNTFNLGTRVHFHRTHPCRSKDGDYNPINRWIKVCFNWMVGNVNRSLIRQQQGDLVFIHDDKEDRQYNNQVDFYDKHIFERPVSFNAYEKKDGENILGYIKLEQDALLTHSEHENILLPAGQYCVRQCRSWEASPRGIWTLRID